MEFIDKLLRERPVTNWIKRTLNNIAEVFEPVTRYAKRLWLFWGPRLADRNFLAMVGANIVAAGFISQQDAEIWQLVIWAGANMLFRAWDNLPDETLPEVSAGVNPHGGPNAP